MSRRVSHNVLIARNEIVAPPVGRACEDHNFGLPPAIHLITAALFMGFVSVLCLALANPGLAVPFGLLAAGPVPLAEHLDDLMRSPKNRPLDP